MNAGSELQERIRTIYAAADAAVAAAGPRCDSSGRCCRFKEWGHTLFISQLEADYLLANAPPFAGPVTDAACPFQIDNLCTAREPRPLGCRVYFCDPRYQDTGAEISERFVRELKMLTDEFGLPWRYAPLPVILREHLETGSRPTVPLALRSEDSASRRNVIPLALVE
jgi:Fe-S-cluster containining protein